MAYSNVMCKEAYEQVMVLHAPLQYSLLGREEGTFHPIFTMIC